MIRAKDQLKNAKEHALCTEYLIPLFEAMGYRDVRYHHGGTLEHGKDITMWKPNEFGARINYAVVAKANNLTGRVATRSEVTTQVEQAFEKPFVDQATMQEQSVQQVIVASNKEVKKEALSTLGPWLARTGFAGKVTFLGLHELWRLGEQHLLRYLVFDLMRRAGADLHDIDQDYTLSATLGTENVTFEIVPRHPNAVPLTLDSTPEFPDTEAGLQQREAFSALLRSGGPVELDLGSLPFVDPPPLLRHVLASADPRKPFEVSLVRSHNRDIVLRITARGEEERPVELPYIHLTTIEGGLVEGKVSNAEQPIPLRVSLSSDATKSGFQFTLDTKNVLVYWALLFCEFTRVGASGTIEVEDITSGGFYTFSRPREVKKLDPQFQDQLIELLRLAREVEVLTQQSIRIGNLELLSAADVRDVVFAHEAVTVGEVSSDGASLSGLFRDDALAKALEVTRAGGGRVQVRHPEFVQDVLGTPIDLGPVELILDRAVIHPDDRPTAEAASAAGEEVRLVSGTRRSRNAPI